MSIIHKYSKPNPPEFEARILGAEDSKFYHEVLKKAEKDFPKGSQYISNNINPELAQGSNFLFVCLADEMLGKDKKISTLNDWSEMLTGGNFAKGVYFDANQLILRSNKATYGPNQAIINHLARQFKGEKVHGAQVEYSPENPLLITGAKLKVSKAKDNQYGLNVILTESPVNAPEFAAGNTRIKLVNLEKRLWTKPEGLSRLVLVVSGVGSNVDDLADSDSYGRVAVVDAVDVQTEEVQKYLKNLKEEKEEQIKEINENYFRAINLLKGK